jgi:hypothetical protein
MPRSRIRSTRSSKGTKTMLSETMQTREAYPLSARQQTVVTLVTQYYAVAQELPSCGWLARRLSISRQRAYTHMETLRRRGWLDPHRDR